MPTELIAFVLAVIGSLFISYFMARNNEPETPPVQDDSQHTHIM